MNGEWPFCETDSLMDELKDAAFEYLLLNPGSEFGDWRQGLIEDYPTEVVDAFGNDPADVYSSLADLWEDDYEDPKTGIEQRLCDWALAFATEQSVNIYYKFVEAYSRLEKQ